MPVTISTQGNLREPDEANRLICVPVYLRPEGKLGFARCSLLPGLSLTTMPEVLHEKIKECLDKMTVGPQLRFYPTHAIQVDEREYLAGVRTRIRAEGISIQGRDESIDEGALARQVLMGLVLLGRVGFTFDWTYTFKVSPEGKGIGYGFAHPNPSDLMPSRSGRTSGLMDSAMYLDFTPLGAKPLRRMVQLLDPYYRSVTWSADRLGVALGYLWNALCTPFPEQSLVGLSMALEAILSTDDKEIAHQLAERASVLLGGKKLDTYGRVKRMYNLRSKIVHGDTPRLFKRGPVTNESLYLTARTTHIPASEARSAVDLCISTVSATIRSPKLRSIIQKHGRKEGAINQDVRDFFIARLLG